MANKSNWFAGYWNAGGWFGGDQPDGAMSADLTGIGELGAQLVAATAATGTVGGAASRRRHRIDVSPGPRVRRRAKPKEVIPEPVPILLVRRHARATLAGQSDVAGRLTAAGAMSAKIKGRGKLSRTFGAAKQNRLSIDEIIADELELVELGVLPYVLTRRDGGERSLDEIAAEEDAMILAGAM